MLSMKNNFKKIILSFDSLIIIKIRRFLSGKFILPNRRFIRKCRINIYCKNNAHVFFGYHDLIPDHGNLVLVHVVEDGQSKEASVGYIRKDNQNFVEIGKTKLCNWQAGSRLQWLPKHEQVIVYHDLISDVPHTLFFDTRKKKKIKKVKGNFYTFSHDGKFGFGFDFKRLANMHKGYGYENIVTEDSLGVTKLDVNTDEISEIVSLKKLVNITNSSNARDHYVNVISVSPDNRHIAFLYRFWFEGVQKTKLMVFDFLGNFVNSFEKSGKISHFTWRDGRTILYSYVDSGGSSYELCDVFHPTKILKKYTVNNFDGHPMFNHRDIDSFVTDTVPDKTGERGLFLVKDEREEEIYREYNPRMGPLRCDLHPKWSEDGEQIFIDSKIGKYREIVTLKADL